MQTNGVEGLQFTGLKKKIRTERSELINAFIKKINGETQSHIY